MGGTSYGGLVYGVIVDAISGVIINDVNVEKDLTVPSDLDIREPYPGVYYAHGSSGKHKIKVSHALGKYKEENFFIYLTNYPFPLERNIYLSPNNVKSV